MASTAKSHRQHPPLFYKSSANDDDNHDDSTMLVPQQQPPQQHEKRRQRVQFAGVTLSPTGFWIVLRLPASTSSPPPPNATGTNSINQNTSALYWPLQLTTSKGLNGEDTVAANSAESLTILQLLASVDMAGAVLPPDLLAKVTVTACEQQAAVAPEDSDITASHSETTVATTTEDKDVSLKIRSLVQASLANMVGNQATKYRDTHEWFQSRVKLPVCTLDEVQVVVVMRNNDDPSSDSKPRIQFQWRVNVQELQEQLTIVPTREHLADIATWNDPSSETSVAFLSIALALRYKAPIIVVTTTRQENHSPLFLTLSQLQEQFPLFRSVQDLHVQSSRVTATIERGFEVNKWQAALRIALQRNDMAAAAKIRDHMDALDAAAAQLLPVQPESDIHNMQ